MIDDDLPAHSRPREGSKRHPERVLDFLTQRNGGPRRQREYKRPHQYRRQDRSPWIQIVQDSQSLRVGEIDTHFFHRFPDGGRAKIGIGRLAAAAWKCDLARSEERRVGEEGRSRWS